MDKQTENKDLCSICKVKPKIMTWKADMESKEIYYCYECYEKMLIEKSKKENPNNKIIND